MKNNTIINIFLLILQFSEIYSQMTDEKRKSLFKKYVKEIKSNKFETLNKMQYYDRGNTTKEIKYDASKISEIIKKYKFPETYNFIEEEKPKVNVKSQGSCGSCWAFSSTTSLSYRFHKLGIEVDLSPQYLVSCYNKNCSGDFLIDTQLYLVKNGTISEGCLPYSSSDGITIEKCPAKCKNGEKFEKYYSKNAYSTAFYYNEDDYYDIVTIIMDQLINNGPVVSQIKVYDDFTALHKNKKCSNIIYRHEASSEKGGSHGVSLVGYGYEDSKYYWIIQNSWGKEFCDNGFAKIEFGQIGVESVAFSDPYIPIDEKNNGENIDVDLFLNEDCKFKFETNLNKKEGDYFEMNFKGVNPPHDKFYYQCSFNSFKNSGECFIDFDFFDNYKGYYAFNDYHSLKTNNTFNLNFSDLSQNKFLYYGTDYIDGVYDYNLYVSEERSTIVLSFINKKQDDTFKTNIYPNINSKEVLNCDTFSFVYNNSLRSFISCDLTSNQLKEFGGENEDLPLVYDLLCGQKEEMLATVNILDKTKYPVFIIKKMILEKNYFVHHSNITFLANMEGSISQFKGKNAFGAFIYIFTKKKNYIEYLHCNIPKPSKLENNFELNCFIYLPNEKIYFDSVELSKYFYPKQAESPFEVIQDVEDIEIIEEEDEKENETIKILVPSNSRIIQFSLYILILILLI